MTPASSGDGRKVVSGIGWNFVAIISEQLSTLVAFVVIARVLGPEDFGVVALAVVIIDILIVLVRGGVSESLIRVDDLTPQLLGTGFWLNMAIGCVLMMAIFVLAPSICAVLDVPQAVPLMRTMSVVFPIAAAGAVAEAVLSRRMAFAMIARRQIVGSTCGAAASIVLALTGFGLWAMIVQRLVIFIVGASLSIVAARFVPPMRFSGKAAGQIARYGSGITSTNMMYRLQPRAAELVIGILAQPLQVALYRAAYRIVDLVNQLPMQPIMRVTFPTLSRLLDTPDRFRAVLLRFTEGLQIMLLPIYAGIGYFSADIFHVLFGSKWDDAVPAFVLLLVASALRVTFAFLGPASAVRGAVKATASFAACDVGISIALMVVAAPWGIEAIAASRIVGAALLWPIAYVLMMKPANLAFGDVMKTLRIPLSISIALLAILFVLDELLAQVGLKLNVLAGIPICAAVYLALVALLSRSHLSELLTTMGLASSPRWSGIARKLRIIE